MFNKKVSLKDDQTKIVVIIAATIIVTLVLCNKAILSPNKEKIALLKENIKKIALEGEIGKLYNQVLSSGKTLSPQKEDSWLRMKITEFSKKANLEITSLAPLTVKNIPPFSYISFRLKTTCTFEQLSQFVNLIESSPNLIALESIKLQSSSKYNLKASSDKNEASIEMVIGTAY